MERPLPPLPKKGFCMICKTRSGQCLRGGTEICVDCALEIAGRLARSSEDMVPARSLAKAMFPHNTRVAGELERLITHERARIAAVVQSPDPAVAEAARSFETH